jgi:hypothetical protein
MSKMLVIGKFKKSIFVLLVIAIAVSAVSQSFAARRTERKLSLKDTAGFLSAFRSFSLSGTDLKTPLLSGVAAADGSDSGRPAPSLGSESHGKRRNWLHIPPRKHHRSGCWPHWSK